MNLSHLRYIAEVAKTGSITKAAQNLYMGQPNLSKAIREMEKSMGTVIFKRTSKGVEPTEKGREIVERACALLRAAEDFENDFCRNKDRTEKISIGICGSEYCVEIFEEMAAKWAGENVSLEFFRSDKETLIGQLKNGDISFGVIRLIGGKEDSPFESVGVKAQLLAEGKAFAAVNRDNALYAKGKISALDIKNMVQIFVSGTQLPENTKDIGVSDTASGKRIVEKNPGCFMTVSSLDIPPYTSKMQGVVYREIEPTLPIRDLLIYAEGKRFSARERELLEGCSRL